MSRIVEGVTATQSAVMEAANHLENSAMETRDHFNNGVSLKDHRSRGNFFRKACFLLLVGFVIPFFVSAQNRFDQYSTATFTPLTPQEIYMAAEMQARAAEANRRAAEERKAKWEHYRNLAYQSLDKGNKVEFITLSNSALSTGWSSSKLYFDRGIAYRDLGLKKNAKTELKKAKKSGYPITNKTIKIVIKNK